jgi:hypothetical protein
MRSTLEGLTQKSKNFWKDFRKTRFASICGAKAIGQRRLILAAGVAKKQRTLS